jgi:uncharacterized membrane protein YfcA
MIALVTVFGMFLFTFGLIGAVRGWAKEMLVSFSVILALAAIALVEDLLGFKNTLFKNNASLNYWFRVITVVFMVFFGYQSPSLPRFAKATERRTRFQDNLLGFFMGLISGYFVVGTLWSFTSAAGYPYLKEYITPVTPALNDITNRVLSYLPPVWLDAPTTIFIFVVVAFIFAIVYFL